MMKYISMMLVLLATAAALHAKNSPPPRLAEEFVIEADRVYVPEEKKVAETKKFCPYKFYEIS